MSLIPFIIATIFLTIAFNNKKSAESKAKTWITVKGKVLEIKTYWTNRKHYAPFITFYTIENQQLFFNGKGSQKNFYQVGQFVEIVYSPLNPHLAEVKYDPSDAEMRTLRFMVGGFFLFCSFPLFILDMIILIGGILSIL